MNYDMLKYIIDYLVDSAGNDKKINIEDIGYIAEEFGFDIKDCQKPILSELSEKGITILDDEGDTYTAFVENKTDDCVASYLRDISSFPLLTAEEEKNLSERISEGVRAKALLNEKPGDSELELKVNIGDIAREKFINCNLRLVVSIAKNYYCKEVDFMDIIQEGNSGLMNAIDTFDCNLGYRFSTYAYNFIKHAITKNIKEISNMIRIPQNKLNEIAMLKKMKYELEQRDGKTYSEEELCEAMNGELDIKKTSDLLIISGMNSSRISLDSNIKGDEESRQLHETISDDSSGELKMSLEIKDIFDKKLNERERDILAMFCGYYGEKYSLAEIASKYGISVSRVRQIKSKAQRKMDYFTSKI